MKKTKVKLTKKELKALTNAAGMLLRSKEPGFQINAFRFTDSYREKIAKKLMRVADRCHQTIEKQNRKKKKEGDRFEEPECFNICFGNTDAF